MKQSLRVAAIAVVLLATAGAFLRSKNASTTREPQPWKVGYWMWAGEEPAPSEMTPDILYVHVQGSLWPAGVPAAREYVAVYRLDALQGLSSDVAPRLAMSYASLLRNARSDRRIVGIQVDYDSPTSLLAEYGSFLQHLRRALPAGTRISITALLDWFRPGSAIGHVIERVDEFVPQFYDTAARRTASGIAAPIDAARWAGVFNAFHVPYRIGISSFGRVARVRAGGTQYFRDATPVDFARRRGLPRSTASNAAGEAIVRYDIAFPIGLEHVEPGDAIEVTFPTTDSVTRAYREARKFQGFCAGVVFFRWPGRTESLSMPVEAVAAMASGAVRKAAVALVARDRGCSPRRCTDLYLDFGWDPEPAARTFRIRADGSLDVFLPGDAVETVRARGDLILAAVPAFSGLRSAYVGRAFSGSHVSFQLTPP